MIAVLKKRQYPDIPLFRTQLNAVLYVTPNDGQRPANEAITS
jgi:hypothetical protein